MFVSRNAFAVVVALTVPSVALSETITIENGGDTFLAGSVVNEAVSSAGDTFMSGRTAVARGAAQGDLHVTGFDVAVSADVAEDVYAFGATVVVSGAILEDLTAAGFSVRTEAGSDVAGNARLFGNSLTINGPVQGALTATGQDIILNAPISGDVQVLARSISFGPDAVVSGTLTYSTEAQIAVPERVAPEDRVIFEPVNSHRAWVEWEDIRSEMPVLPTFMSLLFGFLVSLLFFLALGALMLGFMPRRLENLRVSIANAPGQSMLLGIIGLSMLFGLVPITALTIVGLPFVPIVLLSIVVIWTLGYALGAYSVAMRIWAAMGSDADTSTMSRLIVFAFAIIGIALLNFIPFVGWVANYTLILLGIGAMTRALFLRLMGNPGLAMDIDMQPLKP